MAEEPMTRSCVPVEKCTEERWRTDWRRFGGSCQQGEDFRSGSVCEHCAASRGFATSCISRNQRLAAKHPTDGRQCHIVRASSGGGGGYRREDVVILGPRTFGRLGGG